eukprot:6912235-Pyramimonas_sp.AAC.1
MGPPLLTLHKPPPAGETTAAVTLQIGGPSGSAEGHLQESSVDAGAQLHGKGTLPGAHGDGAGASGSAAADLPDSQPLFSNVLLDLGISAGPEELYPDALNVDDSYQETQHW